MADARLIARRRFLAGIAGTGAALAAGVTITFGDPEIASADKPTAPPGKPTKTPRPSPTPTSTPTPSPTPTPTVTPTPTPTPTFTSLYPSNTLYPLDTLYPNG